MAADVRPLAAIVGPQSTGTLLQNLLQEALGQPAGAQRIRGSGRDELVSSTALFKVLVRGGLGALEIPSTCRFLVAEKAFPLSRARRRACSSSAIRICRAGQQTAKRPLMPFELQTLNSTSEAHW
jgi:hypothetical protein